MEGLRGSLGTQGLAEGLMGDSEAERGSKGSLAEWAMKRLADWCTVHRDPATVS